MLKKLLGTLCVLSFLLNISPRANADILWDWSFGGEQGTFTTDGDVTTPGVASDGVYGLIDFTVTSSTSGGTIGSLSAGDYQTDGPAFSTYQPYTIEWSGTTNQWTFKDNPTLGQNWEWWVFDETDPSNPNKYALGWETGNLNTWNEASYLSGGGGQSSALLISVTSSAPVPEPATAALMGIGIVGLVGAGYRKRKKMKQADNS